MYPGKLTVVGDLGSGKTSVIRHLIAPNEKKDGYLPISLDNCMWGSLSAGSFYLTDGSSPSMYVPTLVPPGKEVEAEGEEEVKTATMANEEEEEEEEAGEKLGKREKKKQQVPTASQLDFYDSNKRFIYENSTCVLLLFAIDSPLSLAHARDYWHREIKRFTRASPVILVANKSDLRETYRLVGECRGALEEQALLAEPLLQLVLEYCWGKYSQKQTLVTKDEAEAMRRELGAAGLVELSADTGEGFAELEQAITAAVANQLPSSTPIVSPADRKSVV